MEERFYFALPLNGKAHRMEDGESFIVHCADFPTAFKIIQKYKDGPRVINKGKDLPVISNQRINAYLKGQDL